MLIGSDSYEYKFQFHFEIVNCTQCCFFLFSQSRFASESNATTMINDSCIWLQFILELENRQIIFIVHAWYISVHSKWQHFASAFNCFVCVCINIYKLAMVRNFTVTMSGYLNWNCSCFSQSQIWFSSLSVYFICFIVVWLSQPNLSLKCSYNYLHTYNSIILHIYLLNRFRSRCLILSLYTLVI